MKKKVVHLIQSLNRGGAERLLVGLAIATADRYDVYVVCQYDQVDSVFERDLTNAGVKLIKLNKKPGFSFSEFFKNI